MNDIDRSYNTDLLGLLHSAEKHNAKVYTGSGTLSQIALAVGDYGHLPSFIERIRKEFLYTDSIVQTPNARISGTMDKLVNIWKLQQELLMGKLFEDFIVINHTVINTKPYFDVHPGRTRLYFHNVYNAPVPVLFIDYSNNVVEGGPFKLTALTEQKCNTFKHIEYRLCDDWYLEQMPINHLLVQPNDNDEWHWPTLSSSLDFRLIYTNDLLTNITVNDRPFMDYTDYVWKINTSIK